MTNPRRYDVETLRVAVLRYGSIREAGRQLGIAESVVRYHMNAMKERGEEFKVTLPPSAEMPIEQLIERRCDEFARRETKEKALRLIPVDVAVDGPFGITHFGDPHVDDPGCDLPLIREHLRIVNDTPGLFGGCVGDYANNWVGRLERLFAKAETTKADAIRLSKWFIGAVPWLYLIGGNHDVWSGDVDPCKMHAKSIGLLYKDHGARLALKLPNGRECRINARHTFNGHSMWNANHGGVKAARMGFRDHIYISGHTHTASYQKIPAIGCDLWHHLLQIGAYKVWDEYPDQIGLIDYNGTPAMTTIIDPEADERSFVQVFDDVAQAADYLTWLRAKRLAA